MRKKTLSVLTPNFNHERFLPQAIEMVARQSRLPDEYIIMDDKSTDNSIETIQNFHKQIPFLKLLKNEKNVGAVACVNALLKESSSDYLYFSAADDFVLPGFFEKGMELAEKFPEAGVIMGKTARVDENGVEIGVTEISGWTEPQFVSPHRFLQEYLYTHRINHSTGGGTIFKRSALLELGGFFPELGPYNDTFTVRAIALKSGACYFPHKCASWRVMPNSFSSTTAKKPANLLKMIACATRRMQSPELRDRFPAEYVEWFSRTYRRFILLHHLYQKILLGTGWFGRALIEKIRKSVGEKLVLC